MRRKEDVSKQTYPRQIRKDTKQLNDLVSYIENCCNPFSGNESELINLATGKAAPKEVSSFLLNVMNIGKQEYDKFVERVIADPAAFEKPIKKQTINNFASIKAKVKRTRNDKVKVLKMERNFVSTLLVASIERKIDMEVVIRYPLHPLPLCLAQPDGTMNKTVKSVLFDIVGARIKSTPPSHIDVSVVDGLFFFHLHATKLPNTFGKIAEFYLRQLFRSTPAKRVDFVLDRSAVSPSIKDCERDLRTDGMRGLVYRITGPNQTKPSNFLKELRGDGFKKALVSL